MRQPLSAGASGILPTNTCLRLALCAKLPVIVPIPVPVIVPIPVPVIVPVKVKVRKRLINFRLFTVA